MKFTREQAIKELEAKIPTKDKDLDLGRTISEIVDNNIEIIGESSEMELSDFVNKTWKSVQTAIGLTHSENSKVAQKLQGQIDELQKKVNGNKGGDDDHGNDNEDPKLKAMQDELDNIKKRLADEDTEKTVSQKRAQLKAKMAESIKDNDWIDSYLAEINVTEETDVEAKAKDYVAFYNKTQANVVRRSTTPRQTGGNDDRNSDAKKTIDSVKAIIQQREGLMGGSTVTTEQV